MNMRCFLVSLAVLGLAACGRAEPAPASRSSAAEPAVSTESLPTYESQGVISSLEGQVLTLDHDGASAAGLKPGRDRFIVYADVLAEAPITPGSRVKFQFRKAPDGLEIAKLESRP